MNVFFDGTYLNSVGGIGRDSRSTLNALKSLNSIKTTVIYPYFSFKKIQIQYSFKEQSRCRLLLFKFVNQFPFFSKIILPLNTIFFQTNVYNFISSSNSLAHVIRLHDIFPVTNPEWFKPRQSWVFSSKLIKAQNCYFLTDSQESDRALKKFYEKYDLKPQTTVVPCILSPLESAKCNRCAPCKNLSINSNFLLSVGTIEPRKNYEDLISKFLLFVNSSKNYASLKLVICGHPGWKQKKLIKMLKNEYFGPHIVWMPNVCDFGLKILINQSTCGISNSLDEGFNLTIPEFLLQNKRVIASNIPIHKELYSGFCQFFDQNDYLSFHKSLSIILSDTYITSLEIDKYKKYTNYQKSMEFFVNQFLKILNTLKL